MIVQDLSINSISGGSYVTSVVVALNKKIVGLIYEKVRWFGKESATVPRGTRARAVLLTIRLCTKCAHVNEIGVESQFVRATNVSTRHLPNTTQPTYPTVLKSPGSLASHLVDSTLPSSPGHALTKLSSSSSSRNLIPSISVNPHLNRILQSHPFCLFSPRFQLFLSSFIQLHVKLEHTPLTPARRRRNSDHKAPTLQGARRRAIGMSNGPASPHSPQSLQDDDNPPPRLFSTLTFLSVGQTFSGSQTVNSTPSSAKDADEWRVNVVIQGLDLANGTICGSMEALDVPKAVSPVVTFWKGEIIDNRNYYFWTGRWEAQVQHDVDHWKKFVAFAPLHARVRRDRGDDIDLSNSRYIFMRWKEIFFVSPGEDCGLTIAGFYYVCMDRQTGAILGFYYDPHSQPYQRLQLRAVSSPTGHSFGDYDFH